MPSVVVAVGAASGAGGGSGNRCGAIGSGRSNRRWNHISVSGDSRPTSGDICGHVDHHSGTESGFLES